LDNRSHLSLRDGAVLSRCRAEKFEHNDPDSLDAALGRQKGRRQLVIVEGIYSMDGDFGKLKELIDVAESHDASVFIDEAHSMLGCGDHGRGAAEHFGVEDRVPLVYGTFSKAFGAVGGFVAGACINSVMNCAVAVSGLRRWITQPSRKTGSVFERA